MEVVSFRPLPLYPQGNSLWYPLDKRLGGPQSRSGRCGEKKNVLSLPENEPQSLSHPACTLVLYWLSYFESIFNKLISWDSSVSIVMGYRLDGWGSIPSRSKRFLSSPPRPDRLWGPPSLLSNGYRGSFPRSKAAEAWSWPLTSI
jgi:hypothetical protein